MLRPLFSSFALFAACLALSATSPADLRPVASRKPASDFSLTDAKGAIIKLSDYKGKVVLLDFWATYCGVCKEEIPWYVEFQTKYKETGLSVVGVSLDEDGWISLKPYLEDKKVNYPVVIGNWDLATQFGVGKGLPVTLLIDRDGRVAELQAGQVNKEKFESEIQVLLKESTPKPSEK